MANNSSYSILFLVPYPFGKVASQRFRFEQYWDEVSRTHKVSFQPFLSERGLEVLYKKGHVLLKILAVLSGFAHRYFLLFSIHKYDVVFIHREACPLGPPIIEWVIAKIFKKKIVYDFDDAIWLENTSGENRMASFLKCPWKVKYICRWAWKVTCGNDFLADFAKGYNTHVYFLPTTLETDRIPYKSSNLEGKKWVLGWTGTHSTLKYLQLVLPVLQELQALLDFEFLVIADKDPVLPLSNYRFLKWHKDTEWEDLAQIDIGIMPLAQSEWEEGKCGFKALQYMALGIPALASPTKANQKIIDSGNNGFICSQKEEWRDCLVRLTKDKLLFERIAFEGRKTVEGNYSNKVWQATYQTLFY